MSYDSWLTEPPPMESADDNAFCVVCGMECCRPSQMIDGRYCGEACAQKDEEGE